MKIYLYNWYCHFSKIHHDDNDYNTYMNLKSQHYKRNISNKYSYFNRQHIRNKYNSSLNMTRGIKSKNKIVYFRITSMDNVLKWLTYSPGSDRKHLFNCTFRNMITPICIILIFHIFQGCFRLRTVSENIWLTLLPWNSRLSSLWSWIGHLRPVWWYALWQTYFKWTGLWVWYSGDLFSIFMYMYWLYIYI